MAELMFPNLAAAIQQGQTFGTNQRLQREGEQRATTLRDLSSRAYAAPAQERQGLIQQAVGVDPDAGFALGGQIEKREADQAARAGNVADYLLQAFDSKNPAQIQGAYNAVKPYFQGIAPPGTVIPDTVDDSILPMLHQLKAASSGASTGLTNEARTFQQLTQGFTPDELAQARRVNAGLAPRAVTGAVKQLEVTGSDGRKRPATFNPSTQTFMVFDETTNSFRPLGQGETVAEAPGPAVAGTGQATTRVDIQGIAPDVQQRIASTAALMAQSGYPQAEIDAFVDSQINRTSPQMPAPVSTAPAGLGVSRSPEEQAAATTAATEAAQLEAYRNATGAAAERETATTTARETAQASAQRAVTLPQTIAAADETVNLLDRVLNHPGREAATGTSSVNPLNRIPGTDAYDFNVLLDQIKGQAFLQAFQSLRGGGAITEREGQAATNAIARLNSAQSEKEFVSAINDLKRIVSSGRDRAINSAGQRQAAPQGWSIQKVD